MSTGNLIFTQPAVPVKRGLQSGEKDCSLLQYRQGNRGKTRVQESTGAGRTPGFSVNVKNRTAPPWPGRAPEAGSHRTSALLETNLTYYIRVRVPSQNPSVRGTPPPPAGRPRGGSVRFIFLLVQRISRPERLDENLPAPPWPGRPPEAGSHHNAGCLVHGLTSCIQLPAKSQQPAGLALPGEPAERFY